MLVAGLLSAILKNNNNNKELEATIFIQTLETLNNCIPAILMPEVLINTSRKIPSFVRKHLCTKTYATWRETLGNSRNTWHTANTSSTTVSLLFRIPPMDWSDMAVYKTYCFIYTAKHAVEETTYRRIRRHTNGWKFRVVPELQHPL